MQSKTKQTCVRFGCGGAGTTASTSSLARQSPSHPALEVFSGGPTCRVQCSFPRPDTARVDANPQKPKPNGKILTTSSATPVVRKNRGEGGCTLCHLTTVFPGRTNSTVDKLCVALATVG